jgi:hypothetical protein
MNTRPRPWIVLLALCAPLVVAQAQPLPPWAWPVGEVLAPSSADTGASGPEALIDLDRGSRYQIAGSPFADTPLLTSHIDPGDGGPDEYYGVLLDSTGRPGEILSLAPSIPSPDVQREFTQLAPRTVLDLARSPLDEHDLALVAQIFDADGPLLQRPLVVHGGVVRDPLAASCHDGRFAIAWVSSEGTLLARVYGADLSARSSAETPIAAGPISHRRAQMACGVDGWLLTWIDPSSHLQRLHLSFTGEVTAGAGPLLADELGALSEIALESTPAGWLVAALGRSSTGETADARLEIHGIEVDGAGVPASLPFRVDSDEITTLPSGLRVSFDLATNGDQLAVTWSCREGAPPGIEAEISCLRFFDRSSGGRFVAREAPSPVLPASLGGHDPETRVTATSSGFLVTWLDPPKPAETVHDANPVRKRFFPFSIPATRPLVETEVTCLARHALDLVPPEPKDQRYCHPTELTAEDAERAAWLLSLFETPGEIALHRTAGIDSFRLHATARTTDDDGSRLTADLRLIFRQGGELDGVRLTPQPACPKVADGEPYPLDCSLPNDDGRLPGLSVLSMTRGDRERTLRPLRLRPGRAVYLEAEDLPSRSARSATSQSSSSSPLGHSSGKGESR